MIDWQWRHFDELTIEELYQMLALRIEVFVVEQDCPYQECDFRDQRATHLLAWQEGKLIGTLRILTSDDGQAMSFGRVVTSPSIRGQGIGKQLLEQAMEHLNKQYAGQTVKISAQLYLQKFYQYYGFEIVGEPYDEDGIQHTLMVKN